MSESVRLPALGESVTEGTVTRWLKAVGERVEIEEPLLEVSTDKVDTEIPSPFSGVLEQILVQEDETVAVGTVLAIIGDGSALAAAAPAAAEPEAAASAETAAASPELSAEPAPEPAPAPTATPPAAATQSPEDTPAATKSPSTSSGPIYVTPIVRKMAREHGVDLHGVTGTGPGGRVSKHDVVAARTAAQATT
ncbi:MAG: biotin/lipoyl-containing protein, partial [Cryobacterium sp.]